MAKKASTKKSAPKRRLANKAAKIKTEAAVPAEQPPTVNKPRAKRVARKRRDVHTEPGRTNKERILAATQLSNELGRLLNAVWHHAKRQGDSVKAMTLTEALCDLTAANKRWKGSWDELRPIIDVYAQSVMFERQAVTLSKELAAIAWRCVKKLRTVEETVAMANKRRAGSAKGAEVDDEGYLESGPFCGPLHPGDYAVRVEDVKAAMKRRKDARDEIVAKRVYGVLAKGSIASVLPDENYQGLRGKVAVLIRETGERFKD